MVYELKIPGLQTDASSSERQIFIDSVLPMENSLMVYCIGNLLNYFDQNNSRFPFPHCFSNFGKTLIITNVTVNFLESQVIIDEATLNALNVFSTIQHPASFKNQIRNDTLSIYNLLNRCCSRIGSQQLKTMLKCPTRDLVELNLRLSTVEWCMKKENMEKVAKLKGYWLLEEHPKCQHHLSQVRRKSLNTDHAFKNNLFILGSSCVTGNLTIGSP